MASDADVSVMAGHCSKMAIDTLGPPAASVYPSSAYAVGFTEAWVFEQPFETFPINLLKEGVWGEVETSDKAKATEGLRKLVKLISPEEK